MDPSGAIVGFSLFMDAPQLSAVLDGNAVAIPRDADDDRVFKMLAGGKVRLDSEPHRFESPKYEAKPDIPPSYEVHISPSTTNGTAGSSRPDFWVERGFDLKSIVSMVYARDPGRVILPATLDNDKKFDFVVVLPKEETQETIYQLVRDAIEKRFSVSATVENKPVEAYLMTALPGKTPPAKTGPDSLGGGFTTSNGFEFSLPPGTEPTPEAINKAMQEMLKHPENKGIANLSAGNTSMDEFRETLERSLDRPVIDETGLDGIYDIEVRGNAKTTDDFIHALREQVGLVLTPATRNIEFLTLRSLN